MFWTHLLINSWRFYFGFSSVNFLLWSCVADRQRWNGYQPGCYRAMHMPSTVLVVAWWLSHAANVKKLSELSWLFGTDASLGESYTASTCKLIRGISKNKGSSRCSLKPKLWMNSGDFWATVCKTVRPMLSDHCLSDCLYCPVLSVCL